MYKIYMITNMKNNLRYIGKTKSTLSHRFSQYLSEKNGLGKYINKSNKKDFKIELIKECNKDESCDLESYYIKKIKTYYPYGYNLQSGGDKNYKFISKHTINNKNAARSRMKKVKCSDGFIYESLTDFCNKYKTSIDNFHRYKTCNGYKFKGLELVVL